MCTVSDIVISDTYPNFVCMMIIIMIITIIATIRIDKLKNLATCKAVGKLMSLSQAPQRCVFRRIVGIRDMSLNFANLYETNWKSHCTTIRVWAFDPAQNVEIGHTCHTRAVSVLRCAEFEIQSFTAQPRLALHQLRISHTNADGTNDAELSEP